MLSGRSWTSRIHLIRPLRPPSNRVLPPGPRLFTQNSQLLLLTRHALRPQLPYLSQPSFTRRPSPLDQQLLRLLSTENRRYVKEQVWLAAKWTTVIWTFIFLGSIAYWGIGVESDERQSPTPSEWHLLTRQALRDARNEIKTGEAQGSVDWIAAGKCYLIALERLENPAKDGKGVSKLETGEDGAANTSLESQLLGLDLSGKSWEWQQGYHEVLMGMAHVSEEVEEMVKDTTRNLVFPRSVVIGPSNPDPRPVSARMAEAPKEENCVRPFDSPETYYMRILTSNGFTTRQKLDAAWGYASWLEVLGLDDSAKEMYRWAVDIAKSPLQNAEALIDSTTYIVRPPCLDSEHDTTPASANLLRAATLLAAHRARTGDVTTALPILLSVLRARRDAPSSLASPHEVPKSVARRHTTDFGVAIDFIRNFFTPPKHPSLPPSGDEPFGKVDARPSCEDSELMLYVGEILFATSPSSFEGLAWTKEALRIAEKSNEQLAGISTCTEDDHEQIKCRQCLSAGLSNWASMLDSLSAVSETSAVREGGRNAGWLEWRGWFGKDGGVEGRTLDEAYAGMFAADYQELERLKGRVAQDILEAEMLKVKASNEFRMLAG